MADCTGTAVRPRASFAGAHAGRDVSGGLSGQGRHHALALKEGDLAVVIADTATVANRSLGNLREYMGDRLGLRDGDVMAFAWILDFPLLEEVEGEQRLTFSHNPFCGVRPGDEELLDSDPTAALSRQYDLVCNGHELGGGSIRIDDSVLQRKVFQLLGYDKSEIDANFGGMLRAFDFGVPPHGGIAPGIDRIIMLLAKEPNIREVIMFPMNQQAQDLMMSAPAPADAKHLREIHIRTIVPEAIKPQ